MPDTEKPHFSKNALDRVERIQHTLGHSILGRSVTWALAGSYSPAYRQLDWFARNVTIDINSKIKVPGDPNAGIVPRLWNRAAVIASSSDSLNDLEEIVGSYAHQEAVAFRAEGIWRIGVMANESNFFGSLNREEKAVAMRLGKGTLEAAMGIWIPSERHFISSESIRVIDRGAFVNSVATYYAGVVLV